MTCLQPRRWLWHPGAADKRASSGSGASKQARRRGAAHAEARRPRRAAKAARGVGRRAGRLTRADAAAAAAPSCRCHAVVQCGLPGAQAREEAGGPRVAAAASRRVRHQTGREAACRREAGRDKRRRRPPFRRRLPCRCCWNAYGGGTLRNVAASGSGNGARRLAALQTVSVRSLGLGTLADILFVAALALQQLLDSLWPKAQTKCIE